MRGLVNRGFTPRRIAELETRVREIARGALAQRFAHFQHSSRYGPLALARFAAALDDHHSPVLDDDGAHADDGALRIVPLHGS